MSQPLSPVRAGKTANLDAWDANATHWDDTLGDAGNDLFEQLIVPGCKALAGPLKSGSRVLDLGTGNGMIARALAHAGVTVVATDYSSGMLQKAAERAERSGKDIEFRTLDLLDTEDMDRFAKEYDGDKRFDVVTGSMLLKELSDLEPLATFLLKILREGGRAIFINPHPCFQKPAAHRVMELYEDPIDGEQKQLHWIKVSKYLNIGGIQSQALRGQPEALAWFHRPIHALLNPFVRSGLALLEIQEPSFDDALKPSEIQSYHNYPQIPMLFTFMLARVS